MSNASKDKAQAGGEVGRLVLDYAATAGSRFEGEASWLRARRDDAMACFEELGFPTSRIEEWKYSARAARDIERGSFANASASGAAAPKDLSTFGLAAFDAQRVVFIDGFFSEALSDSTAATETSASWAHSLRDALGSEGEGLEGLLGSLIDAKTDAFAALNTANFEDGLLLRVPRGQLARRPIHAIFVTTQDAASHPRVLVQAEASSQCTLVIEHLSLGQSDAARFSNAVIEAEVGPNAQLEIVQLQREGAGTLHVSRTASKVERDGRFSTHTITLGGAFVRNDLHIALAAEGAEASMNGLFLGLAEQHIDNHSLVDHAVPHCSSKQLYKGVLGGSARGVFRGRVLVRPDAQKTAAEQSNPNLLISDRAEIDSKPQLEIYADDVRCSHGSTIGQLDEKALFFLRSRGIALDAARELLTLGFASEVSEALPVAELGELVSQVFVAALLNAPSNEGKA